MGYFKKTNAFLVYAICFHETVHDKSCLHKSVRQTEHDLERGFVNHWLNWPNESKITPADDMRFQTHWPRSEQDQRREY